MDVLDMSTLSPDKQAGRGGREQKERAVKALGDTYHEERTRIERGDDAA